MEVPQPTLQPPANQTSMTKQPARRAFVLGVVSLISAILAPGMTMFSLPYLFPESILWALAVVMGTLSIRASKKTSGRLNGYGMAGLILAGLELVIATYVLWFAWENMN